MNPIILVHLNVTKLHLLETMDNFKWLYHYIKVTASMSPDDQFQPFFLSQHVIH